LEVGFGAEVPPLYNGVTTITMTQRDICPHIGVSHDSRRTSVVHAQSHIDFYVPYEQFMAAHGSGTLASRRTSWLMQSNTRFTVT